MKRCGLLVTAALCCGLAGAVEARELSVVEQTGRQFYVEACASCHGDNARGDGPQAASLSAPPSDLTLIRKRRDGRFPLGELEEIIDGRGPSSLHASGDMPRWGERFAEEEGGDPMTEELIRGRVRMILDYLDAVQR